MKLKQIRVDGYKNLIDCKVDLGDFNVLVGPNNSGKSNLLEAIQMLGGLCFGSNKLMDKIFEGLTPPYRDASWICHLDEYKDRPLSLGVTFDIKTKGKPWRVDYDVKIKSSVTKKKTGGFIEETLKAKNPSRKGPATIYISRKNNKLTVTGKRGRAIAKKNSSFMVIASLYPDLEGLPIELKAFLSAISEIGLASVFAIWPDGLRMFIDEGEPISGVRVTNFDLLVAMDDLMEKNLADFNMFRETVCDILDLEALKFRAETLGPSKSKSKEKEAQKRFRFCAVKRSGSKEADIKEFSDGTLTVVGVLASLFSKDREEPMFYLEEVENCLHPAALRRLLQFLQDNASKWPVLLTTHSPYVLNCVNPADVNIAIPDEKTGATQFKKITDRRAINAILKSKYIGFGDLLPGNFGDILGDK